MRPCGARDSTPCRGEDKEAMADAEDAEEAEACEARAKRRRREPLAGVSLGVVVSERCRAPEGASASGREQRPRSRCAPRPCAVARGGVERRRATASDGRTDDGGRGSGSWLERCDRSDRLDVSAGADGPFDPRVVRGMLARGRRAQPLAARHPTAGRSVPSLTAVPAGRAARWSATTGFGLVRQPAESPPCARAPPPGRARLAGRTPASSAAPGSPRRRRGRRGPAGQVKERDGRVTGGSGWLLAHRGAASIRALFSPPRLFPLLGRAWI